MNRREKILTILFILPFLAASALGQVFDESKATKIKAALLYHMTKTVAWPDASAMADEPLAILFLGKDYNEMGKYFESQIRARSIAGKSRRISVKRLTQTEFDDVLAEELRRIHMLYIMSSYNGSIAELVRAIGKRPVLVVGDSARYALEGGMIGLDIKEKHVSISINLDAVKNANLEISAQLLQHAIIVKGKND